MSAESDGQAVQVGFSLRTSEDGKKVTIEITAPVEIDTDMLDQMLKLILRDVKVQNTQYEKDEKLKEMETKGNA